MSARVAGVRVFNGSRGSAAGAVLERALDRDGGYAVLCNAHVFVDSLRDRCLGQALDDAWQVFPDGAPVAWLVRRLAGTREATRIPGPDLMSDVISLGRSAGLRHAFVGSTTDVLDQLIARLHARWPDVRIVGSLAPPFTDVEEWALKVVQRIGEWNPHIVWLGLGAPKQELWMRRYAALCSSTLFMGVGAAFDFHSGGKQRAPLWMQRSGFEWLHRLCSEPRRLGPRYVRTNLAFTRIVLRELASPRIGSAEAVGVEENE